MEGCRLLCTSRCTVEETLLKQATDGGVPHYDSNGKLIGGYRWKKGWLMFVNRWIEAAKNNSCARGERILAEASFLTIEKIKQGDLLSLRHLRLKQAMYRLNERL